MSDTPASYSQTGKGKCAVKKLQTRTPGKTLNLGVSFTPLKCFDVAYIHKVCTRSFKCWTTPGKMSGVNVTCKTPNANIGFLYVGKWNITGSWSVGQAKQNTGRHHTLAVWEIITAFFTTSGQCGVCTVAAVR